MTDRPETRTEARKTEIVNACERLYETQHFRDITIGSIADATTFGRTSVYNYFHTKEEIFLAMAERLYDQWTLDLERVAAMPPLGRNALAEALAETLERNKKLLKVITMNHFEMEEHSRLEQLIEFKRAYKRSIEAVRKCLSVHCTEMSLNQMNAFIYAFFPFIYGIYPYTTVTDKQDLAMQEARLDFTHMSVYEISVACLRQLLGVCP